MDLGSSGGSERLDGLAVLEIDNFDRSAVLMYEDEMLVVDGKKGRTFGSTNFRLEFQIRELDHGDTISADHSNAPAAFGEHEGMPVTG